MFCSKNTLLESSLVIYLIKRNNKPRRHPKAWHKMTYIIITPLPSIWLGRVTCDGMKQHCGSTGKEKGSVHLLRPYTIPFHTHVWKYAEEILTEHHQDIFTWRMRAKEWPPEGLPSEGGFIPWRYPAWSHRQRRGILVRDGPCGKIHCLEIKRPVVTVWDPGSPSVSPPSFP